LLRRRAFVNFSRMLLRKQFENSPTVARVAPFAVFLLLTFCQGKFFAGSEYWFYLAKTLVGAWLIWEMRPSVAEMRWTISVEAIAVGVAVFVMWVGIDPYYPKLGELTAKVGLSKAAGAEHSIWNPHLEFGRDSIAAWLFMAVRVLGMGLVVPPLEEVFYRSFLYRYIARPDFQSVPLARFFLGPFLFTSTIFGFEHSQWLAGVLCGFAYQALVIQKRRLGDAIVAHAITNLLLGVWVVRKEAWQFL